MAQTKTDQKTGKKRPDRTNPCQMKGKLGGRRCGGRMYKFPDGEKVRPKGCECSERWLMLSERNHKRTGKALRFHQTRVEVVSVPLNVSNDRRDLMAAPCGETFRFVDSPGTKLFRKMAKRHTGKRPDFPGCQAVEDQLIAEGLVRHDMFSGIGSHDDILVTMDQDQSNEIRDEKSGEIRFELEIESLPFPNSLVDQPSETPDDQNISLSPSKSRDKLIARWLRTLTRPQLQAVNLVYLKNYDRLSQRAVAEKIGISLDSLKDRLKQALKKFSPGK
jgi:hypothetical protein